MLASFYCLCCIIAIMKPNFCYNYNDIFFQAVKSLGVNVRLSDCLNLSFPFSWMLLTLYLFQNQRRKDPEKTPYINHPIGVANYLVEVGYSQYVDFQTGVFLSSIQVADLVLRYQSIRSSKVRGEDQTVGRNILSWYVRISLNIQGVFF